MKNPWGRAGRYSGLPDTNGEKRNENLTVSTKKQKPGHRSKQMDGPADRQERDGKRTVMERKSIRLYRIQELKELSDIASRSPANVYVECDGKTVDLSSILGTLSIDITMPVTVEYNEPDRKLEDFLNAHADE